MGWKSILVQVKAYLHLDKNQIVIKYRENVVRVPIEDLKCVILESHQIILTNALLSYLQERGVLVISLNKQHMPSGISISFHQHSRQTEHAFLQKNWTEPFKKRIWQFIVKKKLLNQARCLSYVNPERSDYLIHLAENVQSGDVRNKEAEGARYYWKNLLNDFKRGEDDVVNAALNFGYSIVRGLLSRALVFYGFIPCFGLHHDNNLNAYNLSDDLLELFRPMVDYRMLNMRPFSEKITGKLSQEEREIMTRIISDNVLIDKETFSLESACDKVVMHLLMCTRQKSILKMIAPLLSLSDLNIS